ncbi:hypothetical protein FHL15_010789, partial [Xylaria flabelliformis]
CNYGITTKIPRSAFTLERGKDYIKVHEADNGSGVVLHREFCGTCGGGLLEYGENAGDNIYVFYGTMDDHAWGQVEPKGEFFCKLRDPWMPEVEGKSPFSSSQHLICFLHTSIRSSREKWGEVGFHLKKFIETHEKINTGIFHKEEIKN